VHIFPNSELINANNWQINTYNVKDFFEPKTIQKSCTILENFLKFFFLLIHIFAIVLIEILVQLLITRAKNQTCKFFWLFRNAGTNHDLASIENAIEATAKEAGINCRHFCSMNNKVVNY